MKTGHSDFKRNIITIVFLFAYALTVSTLDFHHNHTCCHEEFDGPVFLDQPDHHDPCPVLVLTQAHAPIVTLTFDPVVTSVPLFDPYLEHIVLVKLPSTASRGPPTLS